MMQNPGIPAAGETEGRPCAALPTRYHRFPAHQIKTVPNPSPCPRLEVVFFDAPADVLPNGCLRPQWVMAACAFRLAGGFHGRARVEKYPGGPVLAIETEALDILLGRSVAMPYDLPVLRALYLEIGRLYVLEQARRAMQKARS